METEAGPDEPESSLYKALFSIRLVAAEPTSALSATVPTVPGTRPSM